MPRLWKTSANRRISCFTGFSYAVEKIAKESGESTEEAGRRLRYDTFFQVAEQYEQAKIAVAHNENDQAETVLFHLARGSGIKGMGGIPPVRGNIIRPLLGVSRAEIEQYLKEAGQPYCTDSTNALDVYARNRIRHEGTAVFKRRERAGGFPYRAGGGGVLRGLCVP